MASLANQTISSTYDGLIKTSTDEPVGASGVQLLEDGVGNSLSLSVGRLNNGITVTGTVTATSFSGDGSGLTGISVSPTLDEVTDNGSTTTNNITVGNITATSFIKSGGTSAQFLKADGSIDSSTYLTSFTETNNLTAAVTWANVPDANITQSSVTQHQAALSITESQISDLQSYLTAESDTLDLVTDRGATTTNSITVGGATVNGNLSVTGTILDSSGDAGTSGQILSSTATGTNWIDAPTGGGGTIDGSGTGNTISKWLDADTLTDSIITDNGTTATVTGNLSVTGTVLDSDGDAGTSGQILSSTGTGTNWIAAPSGGGGADYTISEISTNTTAVAEYFYVLTASLTLTLPASPSIGDRVALSNQSGTITPVVARNGNLISGIDEDITIDVDNISVEFIYSGAGQGWVLFVSSTLGLPTGGAAVDGSGTTNYVSKWSDAGTLTDSLIFDNGTNVGVGTSSPSSAYGFARSLGISGTNAEVYVEGSGNKWSFGTDQNGNAYIQGPTPATASYGSLSFNLRGSERLRILPTGGLTFNGDTAAANALDDYEEGTFTVTLAPNTGSISLYSTGNTFTYTKIGQQVSITGLVAIQSVSSPTGNLQIQGLPFATALTTNKRGSASTIFLDASAGYAITNVPSYTGVGTTTIFTAFSTNGFAVNDEIAINFTYFI